MKRTLFVTATDTGVGKTMLCGLLLRFLHGQGVTAGYQKWVSSGGVASADLKTVAALAGKEFSPGLPELATPYCFAYPASPHLAAAMEGRRVEAERLAAALKEAQGGCEWLIVEGVGGVMVPLNRDLLLADLVARLGLAVLIVARSGLGTLNHTLLTIEALRQREIPILGVVLTDSSPNGDETLVADNQRTIAELGGVEVLGRLPWCSETNELHRHFAPIGARILSLLQATR